MSKKVAFYCFKLLNSSILKFDAAYASTLGEAKIASTVEISVEILKPSTDSSATL
jgi:hypothetical protein